MKLEVEVPAGATKVDIGPVLEPILRRLVRLERMNGYKDLDKEEEYHWRNVKPKHRPVSEDDVEAWVTWIRKERELDIRMGNLNLATIHAFLEKNGWKKKPNEHSESYYREAGGPYSETWHFDFMKRPGYGGSQTPFASRITTKVPVPDVTPPRMMVYRMREAVDAIKEAVYETKYDRLTTEDVVTAIERAAHPLVQLAAQAEDEEEV